MNLDTYKFNTIYTPNASGGVSTLWREAGSGRISANGLSQIVVGVNLNEEILKRWGSIDTNRYTYTFGIQLRKRVSGGQVSIGHIIGCGTVNNLASANTPKNRLGDGFNNNKIFDAENSGIFVGSVYFNTNTSLFQAGAMQSQRYQGIFNVGYPRHNTAGNNYSYFYDFSNNGSGPQQTGDLGGLWPLKDWGKMFQDLGNVSSISLANQGTEYFDITADIMTSKTTYFWMRIGAPPQGLQSGSDCTLGRPPLGPRSGGGSNPTCHTQTGSPVIYFGKSDTPYFNVLQNIYPSFNVIGNTNDLQAAVVTPASFARPQFATTGSNQNKVTNPYYDETFSFDAVSTIIIRTLQFNENDWPQTNAQFWNQFQWFSDIDANFSRTDGGGWKKPFIWRNWERVTQQGTGWDQNWGWNFYKLCKWRNYDEYSRGINFSTGFQNSTLWNDTGVNVNFFIGQTRDKMSGVRGVGSYLALSTNAAAQCINMNICTPNVNALEPVKCSTIVNAGACTQNPGSPTDVQYLGWDESPYQGAYCFRNPNDVLCSCANTINDANITDFNRLLKETIGIEVPNYCWADACSAQGTQAWIDPRIDQTACPSDLTFCIAVLDISGANNEIKNSDLYQSCVKKIGESGVGTGKTVSSSTVWITVGVIAGIIIVGLILFIIFRRKSPAPNINTVA